MDDRFTVPENSNIKVNTTSRGFDLVLGSPPILPALKFLDSHQNRKRLRVVVSKGERETGLMLREDEKVWVSQLLTEWHEKNSF